MRNLELREIQVVNGGEASCDTLATTTTATIAADGAAVGIVTGAVIGGPVGAGVGALIGVLGGLIGAVAGAHIKDACNQPGNPGNNSAPGQGGDRKPE